MDKNFGIANLKLQGHSCKVKSVGFSSMPPQFLERGAGEHEGEGIGMPCTTRQAEQLRGVIFVEKQHDFTNNT